MAPAIRMSATISASVLFSMVIQLPRRNPLSTGRFATRDERLREDQDADNDQQNPKDDIDIMQHPGIFRDPAHRLRRKQPGDDERHPKAERVRKEEGECERRFGCGKAEDCPQGCSHAGSPPGSEGDAEEERGRVFRFYPGDAELMLLLKPADPDKPDQVEAEEDDDESPCPGQPELDPVR